MHHLLTIVPKIVYTCNMKGKKPKKQAKTGVYTTNLRLPNKLADQVKESADVNKRSINGEIEFVLTKEYSG